MTVKILSEEEFQAKLGALRKRLDEDMEGKSMHDKTHRLMGYVTSPEAPVYLPEQLERIFDLAKS